MSEQRRIMVFNHRHRPAALQAAAQAHELLRNAGIQVVDRDSKANIELIIVLGGDGTILEAANIAHLQDVPVIGVNLGHVGFLAEAEQEGITEVCQRAIDGEYRVESRM